MSEEENEDFFEAQLLQEEEQLAEQELEQDFERQIDRQIEGNRLEMNYEENLQDNQIIDDQQIVNIDTQNNEEEEKYSKGRNDILVDREENQYVMEKDQQDQYKYWSSEKKEDLMVMGEMGDKNISDKGKKQKYEEIIENRLYFNPIPEVGVDTQVFLDPVEVVEEVVFVDPVAEVIVDTQVFLDPVEVVEEVVFVDPVAEQFLNAQQYSQTPTDIIINNVIPFADPQTNSLPRQIFYINPQSNMIIDPISIQPQVLMNPPQQTYLNSDIIVNPIQLDYLEPTRFTDQSAPMIASISPILYQPNENLPQQYVGVVPFNEEVVQYDEEREGFQEEEYISEDTMNVLCSPLLPGQYSFPAPNHLNAALEEMAEERAQVEFERQRIRLEEDRMLQEQQQILDQNELNLFELQSNKRRHKNMRRQQKIEVVDEFQQRETVQEFIQIETNEIEFEQERKVFQKQDNAKLRQMEFQQDHQFQKQREEQERRRLEQQQVQIFRIQSEKVVESQINVYSQPKNLNKFTIENAVAFRDPSAILESPIYYNQFFEWKEGIAIMTTSEIKFPDKSVKLHDTDKVKVMKETAVSNSRKIKVSYATYFYIFSVDPKSLACNLPLHYYWFAKVIVEKMRLKGCNLEHPYIPERVKTNVNVKNQLIDGIIYKKSQYFGRWELRYIAITQNGLFSFKDQTGAETFSIRKDTTTELWTRFEIHEKMLVVKVHHSNRKTEFAIPIVNYCEESEFNWLLALYRLVYSQ